MAGGWFGIHADFRPVSDIRMEQTSAFIGQPPAVPAVAVLDEAPAVPAEPDKDTTLRLRSVEGIALNDSIMELIGKKGKPLAIHSDPRLNDLEVYDYGSMDVAFRDGDLLYVEVDAEARTVHVDGVPLLFEPQVLRDTLGEPDFAAEDGWGYKRGFGAIKFYTDMATGQILSVHFFDAAGI